LNRKVLLVVGGTGGHIYPGIALAQQLGERVESADLEFAVDRRPLAYGILNRRGYRIHRITSAPFPRMKFWYICKFMAKMVYGFGESYLLLKKMKPRVVVAFGAYISVPVVIAACLRGIPVILHEQNYFPGMANRLLAMFADRIAVSYQATLKHFPGSKTVLTGNPVRKELFEVQRHQGLEYFELSENVVTVLVFGGSQGSKSINHSLLGVLPYLEGLRSEVQFVHICGSSEYNRTIEEYSRMGFTARVYRYLEDMSYAYSVADIMVARAGATTIAEAIAMGIPMILIPYPAAAAQHQMLNAKPVSISGGGICYDEERLSGEGLALRIIPLIKDRNRRREMSIKAGILKDRFVEASRRVAELVEAYLT